jgi:hypothetical protein
MWSSRTNKLTNGLMFFMDLDGKPASFADVLRGWQSDAGFRSMYNDLLAGSPYSAFRWETPPATSATLSRSFEFVLLDSPSLTRTPDSEAFAEYFQKSSETEVVEFSNLGGDAILIVPRPNASPSTYVHLASFVREAPESQRHALWQLVGSAMSRRIGAKPVWLSTAGAGVSWLHVRLDDRPKYYGHGPYKQVL